jgi:hypothetical protein
MIAEKQVRSFKPASRLEHPFTTVSLGYNGAHNPCMVPRSQQRPMFYSTNQKSSVAISSADRFQDRIGF